MSLEPGVKSLSSLPSYKLCGLRQATNLSEPHPGQENMAANTQEAEQKRGV